MREDIRAGRLKPIDLIVYEELLSLRVRTVDSAWCAKRTMARRIKRTERTVQSSWARLKEAGWIVHAQIEAPDPDEPRNMTGWRFFFPRIAADGPAAASPPRSSEFLPPPPAAGGGADEGPRGVASFSESPISPKLKPFEAEELNPTCHVGGSAAPECPEKAAGGPLAPPPPDRPGESPGDAVGRLEAARRGPLGLIPQTNPHTGAVGFKQAPGVPPLSAAERAEILAIIRAHGPAALAAAIERRRQPAPAGGAGVGPGTAPGGAPSPGAPPVPPPVAAALRRAVGALGHDRSRAALDTAVAEALRVLPGDGRTERFYRTALGMFQRGRLAQATIDTALRRALDGTPENRAAVFVSAINSDPAMGPGRSPSPPKSRPHRDDRSSDPGPAPPPGRAPAPDRPQLRG